MRPTSIVVVAAVALFACSEAASNSDPKLSVLNAANTKAVNSARFLRIAATDDDESGGIIPGKRLLRATTYRYDEDSNDDDDQNGEERKISPSQLKKYSSSILMAEDDATKAAQAATKLKGQKAILMKQIQNTRYAEGRINDWAENGLTLIQVKQRFGGNGASADMKKAINLYAAVELINKQSRVAIPKVH